VDVTALSLDRFSFLDISIRHCIPALTRSPSPRCSGRLFPSLSSTGLLLRGLCASMPKPVTAIYFSFRSLSLFKGLIFAICCDGNTCFRMTLFVVPVRWSPFFPTMNAGCLLTLFSPSLFRRKTVFLHETVSLDRAFLSLSRSETDYAPPLLVCSSLFVARETFSSSLERYIFCRFLLGARA